MTITNITRPIRRVYYKFRFFKSIWNSYIAPWEWVDSILEINMKMFMDFYKHGDIDNINWDSDECHNIAKQKMDEIYEFWTKTYKQREEEIEVLLDTWAEHYVSWWNLNDDREYYQYRSINNKYAEHVNKLSREQEDLFEREKQQVLEKLISIRNFMWT